MFNSMYSSYIIHYLCDVILNPQHGVSRAVVTAHLYKMILHKFETICIKLMEVDNGEW